MANNTGKKMTARTPTWRPLSSRPMDLIYFIFFLVRVRVFITPLSIHPSESTTLYRHHPPIAHYIPLFRRNNIGRSRISFCSWQLTDLSHLSHFQKKKKSFWKIDSYTIHAVDRLPSGMAETFIPEVPARHPLLVRGHVRGSSRRSCHGYTRRRIRPRVVHVIPVSRSVSYDQCPCPPLSPLLLRFAPALIRPAFRTL